MGAYVGLIILYCFLLVLSSTNLFLNHFFYFSIHNNQAKTNPLLEDFFSAEGLRSKLNINHKIEKLPRNIAKVRSRNRCWGIGRGGWENKLVNYQSKIKENFEVNMFL